MGLKIVGQGLVSVLPITAGLIAPGGIMTQMWTAFRMTDMFGGEDLPQMRFTRSCDNGRLQQQVRVLLATKLDIRESCVFGNIEGCLTDEAKLKIDSLLVDEDVAADSRMLTWINENRRSIFCPGLRSPCLIHGTPCGGHPSVAGEPTDAHRFDFASTTCTG